MTIYNIHCVYGVRVPAEILITLPGFEGVEMYDEEVEDDGEARGDFLDEVNERISKIKNYQVFNIPHDLTAEPFSEFVVGFEILNPMVDQQIDKTTSIQDSKTLKFVGKHRVIGPKRRLFSFDPETLQSKIEEVRDDLINALPTLTDWKVHFVPDDCGCCT